MSILVKGMEMPKNCDKCIYLGWSNFYQIYVCNAVRKDEPVLFNRKQVKSTDIVRGGRADNCHLIYVPKHGRLIDADALKKDLQRQCDEIFKVDAVSPDDFYIKRDTAYNQRLWKTWCESFYNYLNSRLTIIEAEDGT